MECAEHALCSARFEAPASLGRNGKATSAPLALNAKAAPVQAPPRDQGLKETVAAWLSKATSGRPELNPEAELPGSDVDDSYGADDFEESAYPSVQS